tara:strand:- start:5276 stop:6400 length:1125 start_codon:yes stop_codon:yes gene_type:complete
MKYVPPLNGDLEDPERPWVDANPGLGAEGKGSKIAAKGIEHTQREVVAAITVLGLDPDEEDLEQLGSGIIAYIAAAIAASGAPNKVAKAGDTMTGPLNMSGAAINEAQGAVILSSATPDIASATGNSVDISNGGVSITGFPGGTPGMRRMVRFTGVSPALLTNSGTLQLPGQVPFQPNQYDQLEFKCNTPGSWTCIRVVRWNGQSVIARVASTAAAGEVELSTDSETLALADATRGVTPSNLGALLASATQKGILELADATEFATGTDATRALTAALFAKSIASSGYIKLPGGLIIQWGTQNSVVNSTDGSGANSTVTLPVAFATAMYGAQINLAGTSGGSTAQTAYIAVNASSFKIAAAQAGSNNYFWIAVGK